MNTHNYLMMQKLLQSKINILLSFKKILKPCFNCPISFNLDPNTMSSTQKLLANFTI